MNITYIGGRHCKGEKIYLQEDNVFKLASVEIINGGLLQGDVAATIHGTVF